MQHVPFLPGHCGLGLLALESHLCSGHGGLGSLDSQLVVAWVDDDEHIAGSEEPASDQSRMHLHDLALHLRHDIDRHLGYDFTVPGDRDGDVGHGDIHDLHQWAQLRALDAGRRLARSHDHGRQGDTCDQYHDRQDELDLVSGHHSTS